MKIAICENEKLFSEDNVKKCREYFEIKGIQGEIFEFSSGEEFLSSKDIFDVLLLDIEMEEISGIDVKKILEDRKSNTSIIFLTSHSEFMREAFGRKVYSFLSKPLDKEELFKSLDIIAKELYSDYTIEIELENEKIKLIKCSSILYIKAQDKYTVVKTFEKNYLVRKTMKEWEEELLGHDFYRAHKSFLVNMAHIKKVGPELLLEDDTIIGLGRNSLKEFRDMYNSYIRKILG